jgi:acyl-CoA synthetase (AMP-forming)/AMP-acid ligase II
VSPADDAIVVYTSGTTALPKGVLHGHRAPALQSWRFARELGLDREDRVWSAFPLFWTAGFAMVMGATLAAGGCLVLQEQLEPGQALGLLEAERVTCAHGWPHQLSRLEEHPDWETTDLSSLRRVEAIGSFARHKTVTLGDTWSPRAAYGLSETFTIVSSTPAGAPAEDRAGHQGGMLPGNAVRILDPDSGEPQPPGVDGLIAVKGPTLMKGYLKVLPEECFDADGFFRRFLRGRIATYKRPRRVLFFDDEQLSLTGNAKIRAQALRQLALERMGQEIRE